ncbi:hypothetical protein ACFLQZ_04780 [Acidobacteriota bacterium]
MTLAEPVQITRRIAVFFEKLKIPYYVVGSLASSMFKIDVFLSKNDDLSREEMSRREKYQVDEEKGQDLYLASAEDIILSKLQWYKSGGCVSERQWNDVKGVLRIVDKRLDFIYLQDRAKKKGLKDLLDEALVQVEES